jgi:hypothetical protein
LCSAIDHSQYLLFADDIKIFLSVKSPYDCSLLQSILYKVVSLITL